MVFHLHTPIKRWVRAYKAFGEEGLKRKTKKEVYSVQFKLDVLHFMKQTGASYQDTAIQFNLNNPSFNRELEQKIFKRRSRRPERKTEGTAIYV